MNDTPWMSKAEFFEALDRPMSEDGPDTYKQMHLFGPYYIQDLSFKQCLEYPKRKHDVTYKDRFPLYRLCDLAYPLENTFSKETLPLKKACLDKCKELLNCKGPDCNTIRYEMAMFIKSIIDRKNLSPSEEGVMQAYHPIVPYEEVMSRYEAEKKVPHPDNPVDHKKIKKSKIKEATDSIMARIGPRIVNPDLSDSIDIDYGFGNLGDRYNQSAMESLEKACTKYHLVSYSRFANDNDVILEGIQFFDDPDWVTKKWDSILEAVTDATSNVPPSIPTVNISLMMKKNDMEDIPKSRMNSKRDDVEGFDVEKFSQFLAINQRYRVSSSAFSEFMSHSQYDYIAGYVNDGPVFHIQDEDKFVMPVLDSAESNAKKLLVLDPKESRIKVEYFQSSKNIV